MTEVYARWPSLPGLRWGIKQSFLEYIARMPDGRGTVSDGATPTEFNEMVFEPDGVERSDERVSRLRFRGDVRFAGHHGFLFVRLADPWVSIEGDRGALSVLDVHEPDTAPRIPLVTFAVSDHQVVKAVEYWTANAVRLTEEGCEVFNKVYPPGELFDPLVIALPVGRTTEAVT
ncbi:HtaA domain-containing protein [Nocardioides zeae]|uniref:HtaA domain-containing protein n=1 Tax=Nocardioides imazamoxiresistens TaxID=3231893 RepID=A0ABU3PSC3_9ACTN|nr:HtaA domain-containing protein [Nocardioides zeae]MDT9592128.1 HtaA domain-containing protein [Nocardioides zeae]